MVRVLRLLLREKIPNESHKLMSLGQWRTNDCAALNSYFDKNVKSEQDFFKFLLFFLSIYRMTFELQILKHIEIDLNNSVIFLQ